MMLRYSNYVILQPELLFLLIPLAIITIYILRKRFVKDKLRLFKSRGKFLIFLSKMIFFTLIIIALSSPYKEYEDTSGNLSKIKVLIDRSKSMELYDIDEALLNLEVPSKFIEYSLVKPVSSSKS